MKVDVEGFGLRVLRGARRTIERFRPFILFEVHRTFDEKDEIHALKMLKGLGYNFVVVEPSSRRNFTVYAYPMEKACLCYEQTHEPCHRYYGAKLRKLSICSCLLSSRL
jgi:hypothetical protein